MQDLAEAAKRVSEKKRELDELSRREDKVEKLQSFLERLDADQEVADSAVSFINFNSQLQTYVHYPKRKEVISIMNFSECYASKQWSSLKVSEMEEEVLKAEAEMRAAELALVMARAGNSASELSGKWETSDVDEDAERIESGKVRFPA